LKPSEVCEVQKSNIFSDEELVALFTLTALTKPER
jgi:hypothetical protein